MRALTRRLNVCKGTTTRTENEQNSPKLLDYLVEGVDRLLGIEVKDENIARGTMQLVAEFIALDHWLTREQPVLYRTISTGTLWQCVVLHQTEKRMVQDVNALRVSPDLGEPCAFNSAF